MSEGEQAPPVAGLRRSAVGLGGAVIMSAAIMGPAVSTFFNPQYSRSRGGGRVAPAGRG
jgi:hypothetical protein